MMGELTRLLTTPPKLGGTSSVQLGALLGCLNLWEGLQLFPQQVAAAEEGLPLLLGGCSPPGAGVWTASQALGCPGDGRVTGRLVRHRHTAISSLATLLLAHPQGVGHYSQQVHLSGQISGERTPGRSLSRYPCI